VAPTGISIKIVDLRAVRPLLRRREGKISTPPALAPVVAAVDRRTQEASLLAEEVAEAEVRSVPDQGVGAVAVVQAVEAAVVEVEVEVGAEAEFSPGLTPIPELPHQVAHDFTKSLLVSLPLFFGSSHCPP
jgi:hypothetical protein